MVNRSITATITAFGAIGVDCADDSGCVNKSAPQRTRAKNLHLSNVSGIESAARWLDDIIWAQCIVQRAASQEWHASGIPCTVHQHGRSQHFSGCGSFVPSGISIVILRLVEIVVIIAVIDAVVEVIPCWH